MMNTLNNIHKINELQELCEPLFIYLKENHNPHTKIIIDTSGAELVSGEIYAINPEWLDDAVENE